MGGKAYERGNVARLATCHACPVKTYGPSSRGPISDDEIERTRIRRRLGALARASRAAQPPPSPTFRGTREERARLISELRLAGSTYEAIGQVLGISRHRVAQISHKADRGRSRRG